MWNIAGDPYQALMIDITPPKERSTYNAILTVLSLGGQVGLLLFATHAVKKNNIPNSIFYACIGILFLTFAVVFLGVREPKVAASVAQVENKIPLRAYVAEMRAFKEAFKLLVSIFFLWTGLNAILPFITLFPKKIVGASNAQSILIYLVLILAAAICAYPFGRLAKRYGNRALIVVGTVMLIGAALLGLVVPSYFWLFPLAILAGAGFSATTALTYPYLSLLIPGSKIGVFTGLQTAFSAVAAPISIGLTGLLIDHFGYRSIFAMLAVMMVFDVLVLLSIDETAAQRQVHEVDEQERLLAGQTSALPAV
jgi:MFS family permease